METQLAAPAPEPALERRGPGRPRKVPGRPRKLFDEYLALAAVSGKHGDRTKALTECAFDRYFLPYLKSRGLDSEEVTVQTIIDFHDHLVGDRGGLTPDRGLALDRVVSFYRLKASRDPAAKRAAAIAFHFRSARQGGFQRAPRVGTKQPFKPLPLDAIPRALEAARHVVQREAFGDEHYSEAYPAVAMFIGTALRAQGYGAKTADVQAALDTGSKILPWTVKKKKALYIPVHDEVWPILRRHLDERDFEGPFVFRHGRDPYGSGDWRENNRAVGLNDSHVGRILRGKPRGSGGVETELAARFGIHETLQSHRFRKSVGYWSRKYGIDQEDLAVQFGHGNEVDNITEYYTLGTAEDVQRTMSQINLLSIDWVAANPPRRQFGDANGNEGATPAAAVTPDPEDGSELAALRRENAELRGKLDKLLEVLQGRVVA